MPVRYRSDMFSRCAVVGATVETTASDWFLSYRGRWRIRLGSELIRFSETAG